MRAGRCLGMVLHTEGGYLQGAPIPSSVLSFEFYMRKPDRRVRKDRIRVHAVAVILRCDLDFARCEVLYRLICATVPEFEFECCASQRKSHHLVSEADAEYGLFAE